MNAVVDGYREMLARLDELGPASDAPEDLDAFGEVKDVLLARLAVLEPGATP